MRNLIKYYTKIFDELIPGSKNFDMPKFSSSVKIDKFLKNIQILDKTLFNKLTKKFLTKEEVINLIGQEILEVYFLSEKTTKKLERYEKKKSVEKKHKKYEIKLFDIITAKNE